MCGHTRDPVIYSKFHRNPFKGFGAQGVKIWPFPLLWLVAFTTACSTVQAVTSRDCRNSDLALAILQLLVPDRRSGTSIMSRFTRPRLYSSKLAADCTVLLIARWSHMLRRPRVIYLIKLGIISAFVIFSK